jgi:hypothetical protein
MYSLGRIDPPGMSLLYSQHHGIPLEIGGQRYSVAKEEKQQLQLKIVQVLKVQVLNDYSFCSTHRNFLLKEEPEGDSFLLV